MSDVDTTTEIPADDKGGADNEPLGTPGLKALQEEREARRTAEEAARNLQAQLDAINSGAGKQAATDGDEEGWRQQIAELQARLDAADAARKAAEATAKTATLAQLRTDRAEGKLPAALARKLTAPRRKRSTPRSTKLLPFVQSRPRPNPQQGNPSQARGGSMSAGRERYAAKSN
ncbi:hypothetical protein GS885_24640 [Rhodococcus hoagii]|nr:hypothetical protein [Prescottella equi]